MRKTSGFPLLCPAAGVNPAEVSFGELGYAREACASYLDFCTTREQGELPGDARLMARLLANGIGSGLGQPVVDENMPGASGLLAHQAVARAQPDGYTLLFTNTSGMSINPVSFKTLPYDPARDFTAVAM